MTGLLAFLQALSSARSRASVRAAFLIWWRYWRRGRAATDAEFAAIVAECWNIPPGQDFSVKPPAQPPMTAVSASRELLLSRIRWLQDAGRSLSDRDWWGSWRATVWAYNGILRRRQPARSIHVHAFPPHSRPEGT